MLNIKLIFLTLLGSNFFAMMFIGYNFYSSRPTIIDRITTAVEIVGEPNYAFDDPVTAYYTLRELDVFEPVDDKYYNNFPSVMNTYNKPLMGFKSDDNYCDRHRAFFCDHPESIFTEKNFLTDNPPGSLVRKVLQNIGNDIHPKIGSHLSKSLREKWIYDFRPDINIYFTSAGMHTYKHLNKHYGCITQIVSSVPGRATLNRKDYAAESVVEYAKQYETRPQCFNYDKFFPKTWVLRHQDQCEDFFNNNFQGPEYEQKKEEQKIVYIRKIGAGTHQAAGVQPVNDKEEADLRDTYKNGTLCGKVAKSTIIQTYIHNPLLLNGHKFDFRIYLVIASTEPNIVYYHDGFLRVSLHPYNVSSDDKSVLLTNTALSTKIFDIAKKEGNYQGLNETELRNFQMWNFNRLQNYLLENEYINDNNWLDNYLRPEFKRAFIHLIRMTEKPFLRRTQVYELFGCDFMLDDNLNLWFIECNSGPVLTGSSDEKEKFVSKMLTDQFEIVYNLLKSRCKRIINFVNQMMRNNEVIRLESGGVSIKDLDTKRAQFQEILKNRFEPEFEVSEQNGFHCIINDNFEGPKRYSNLISEECI